jgi:hypothetical protein
MKPYTAADAETELRAAIDRDDLEAIKRLEKVVDDLDVHPAPVSLHSAALYYASVGLHVFPLSPGSKIPFKGSGGCRDATTDAERINAWWTGNPNANIGIATGHLVDVVDIDGFEGQASRAKNWETNFAAIDTDALAKVVTPRPGGMHIYVPATGDGNSAGIYAGIDYRGLGGYVVAPPSINEQGSYRFFGPVTFAGLAPRAA